MIENARKVRAEKENDRVGKKISHSTIDLEWIDSTLQKLFGNRQNKDLDTRIRFNIQDLMDVYEKDWKFEIYAQRSSQVDELGFSKKYVPKSTVMTTDPKAKGRRKNSRAQEDSNTGYMYMQKKKPADEPKDSKNSSSMYSLMLNGLKPDEEVRAESHSDDEDAIKLVDRKISLNQTNVVGLDFEKYNDLKPTPEIKRKITNLCLEYHELKDRQHAAEEFI